MFDDTPTPKQSATWNLWKAAVEELLTELVEYSILRRNQRDRARASQAEALATEAAHLIELMGTRKEWTDDIRVLRQQSYLDLRHRFEILMAGALPVGMCDHCPWKR